MANLAVSAAVLVLVSSVAAASPEVAARGTLRGAIDLGEANHPDGGGFMTGIAGGAELQFWWLILGGTVGVDRYPGTSAGASISGIAKAAHLGVSVPLYRRQIRGRALELRGHAAGEIGRHGFAVSGDADKHTNFCLVLCETVTYQSPTRSTRFLGGRAGLSFAYMGLLGTGAGLVFATELVARRDRDTVEIEYTRTSCSDLFTTTCSTSSGKATAGGHDVSLVISVGLVLGR